MEKTLAASVDESTLPNNSASSHCIPRTKRQNSPVSMAVITTPALASSIEGTATGRAAFQLVPKPP